MKKLILILFALLAMNMQAQQNPAKFITNPQKLQMLQSLKDLEGNKGRLYELNYTADYNLDEIISLNLKTAPDLFGYLAMRMYDVKPTSLTEAIPNFGCSAFSATTPEGTYQMCRNYDYFHQKEGVETPASALVVHIHPKTGYSSISMVDSYWAGLKQGFCPGTADISQLIGVPFMLMDGMNEKGLAVCVLQLNGPAALQNDSTKNTLFVTITLRLMLDRCQNVQEAVEMLEKYNISCQTPSGGSMHLYMADAEGKHAIVEWEFQEGVDMYAKDVHPNVLKVYTDEKHSFVTNDYISPLVNQNMKTENKIKSINSSSSDRYATLKLWLRTHHNTLSFDQATELIHAVAVNRDTVERTGQTLWSSHYDLSKKTLTLNIRTEFDKVYTFQVK